MKKKLTLSFFILLVSLIFNTNSFSSHLKDKSKKEKAEYLEVRTVTLPSQLNKVKIAPANKIKNLSKKIVENKNTKKIDKNINKKSLLSVLYFDGQNVVVDKKSDKIDNETKTIFKDSFDAVNYFIKLISLECNKSYRKFSIINYCWINYCYSICNSRYNCGCFKN